MCGLRRFLAAAMMVAMTCGFVVPAVRAEDRPAVETLQIDGRPLGDWVSQATAESGPDDLERTVAALTAALRAPGSPRR